MDEYIKIAKAVSRTLRKVYEYEADDIESVALVEAIKCYNNNVSTFITVKAVRSRVKAYVKRFSKPLPVDDKPLAKTQVKMFTTVSDKELDKLWEHAYSGKKIAPKELRELIERFKTETCFIE